MYLGLIIWIFSNLQNPINRKYHRSNHKRSKQSHYLNQDLTSIREINISEWIAENQDKDKPLPDESSLYVFQVGSFKDYESADQVKAQLALIGIKADIQRVVINGQDSRHRVRIGPYKDQKILKDIRQRLNSNGLDYMLLKLRLEDGMEG